MKTRHRLTIVIVGIFFLGLILGFKLGWDAKKSQVIIGARVIETDPLEKECAFIRDMKSQGYEMQINWWRKQ